MATGRRDSGHFSWRSLDEDHATGRTVSPDPFWTRGSSGVPGIDSIDGCVSVLLDLDEVFRRSNTRPLKKSDEIILPDETPASDLLRGQNAFFTPAKNGASIDILSARLSDATGDFIEHKSIAWDGSRHG